MCEKSSRGRKKVYYEEVDEEFDEEFDDEDCREYELERLEDELSMSKHSISDKIFGRIVKKPYLHYLFTSRIDYKIHYLAANICYKSITVRNPTLFKNQYGFDSRIFIAENRTILFCGCHRFTEADTIIQPYNSIFGNYDADEQDCEKFDYELPSKVFKHLYKFISQINNKGKDTIINNFEILIRRYEKPPEEPPQISFTVGKINFYKTAPSSVKREIENNKRKMLKRNFDKRDDWSNVKPNCHALNEHEEGLMVLPEFKINHKYYSTHASFKDFEPIRISEYFKDDDDEISDKPCKTRKAYDQIADMIEKASLNGKTITQEGILKKAKKLDSELYKNLLEEEIRIVSGTEEN